MIIQKGKRELTKEEFQSKVKRLKVTANNDKLNARTRINAKIWLQEHGIHWRLNGTPKRNEPIAQPHKILFVKTEWL